MVAKSEPTHSDFAKSAADADSTIKVTTGADGTAEFDKLYVRLMLIHHDGAISMATVGAETPDSELVELSKEIVRVQTLEIETLLEILN